MNENQILSGKKIIVAEDDENSFLLLHYILDEFNAEIIHTLTGKETIEAIRANPDVFLVLMDIRMPDINGLETTSIIREFNTQVPIIMQTALMMKDEDEKIIYEAGGNDIILKPIVREQLIQKIKRLV